VGVSADGPASAPPLRGSRRCAAGRLSGSTRLAATQDTKYFILKSESNDSYRYPGLTDVASRGGVVVYNNVSRRDNAGNESHARKKCFIFVLQASMFTTRNVLNYLDILAYSPNGDIRDVCGRGWL
jgi:hypothetical protein